MNGRYDSIVPKRRYISKKFSTASLLSTIIATTFKDMHIINTKLFIQYNSLGMNSWIIKFLSMPTLTLKSIFFVWLVSLRINLTQFETTTYLKLNLELWE